MLMGPVTSLQTVFVVSLPVTLVVIKIDTDPEQSGKFEQICEVSEARLSQKSVNTLILDLS